MKKLALALIAFLTSLAHAHQEKTDLFSIEINNPAVARKYARIMKKYGSFNSWWDKKHRTKDFDELAKFDQKYANFKKFADILESASAKFPGTYAYLRIYKKDKLTGLRIEAQLTSPADTQAFKDHYTQTPLVSMVTTYES